MNSIKTAGIVIRGINFGEADKILTIFTERLGKIRVIAKGIRKIKSHLAGSLEPFMVINLQLHESRTFYIVTGATIESEFINIRTDLKKTAKSFFLGEIVDKFLEEERSTEIFFLFKEALFEINNGLPGPLIQAFELKIINSSGFQPELFHCVHCKVKLTAGNNFWDNIEGGLVCGKCKVVHHHGSSISDNAIKLLRFLTEHNFKEIAKLKVELSVDNEVDKILHQYIENILERELKSQKFLKMV